LRTTRSTEGIGVLAPASGKAHEKTTSRTITD
jgi:hypothetical protein